jgi:hypothetical protein
MKIRVAAIALSSLPALACLAATIFLNQVRIDTINRGQDATMAYGSTAAMAIIGISAAGFSLLAALLMMPVVKDHHRAKTATTLTTRRTTA